MGIFDKLKPSDKFGVIDYGGVKRTGGHDHRNNQGDDRTPAQKEADKKRRKQN